MNIETWLLFFTTTFVATIAPGPSVLLGLNQGIIYGRIRAIATAMGVTTAALVMGFLALVGLGALIVTSEFFFKVCKYLGAGYLIYLGLKVWFSPIKASDQPIKSGSSNSSFYRLYFQAFFVGMSNPKAIIFFTALFPQFINPELPQTNQFIILLFTLAVVVFICMMLYIISGQRIAPLLRIKKLRLLLNKITGGTFIGFGIGVALSD